MLNVSYTPPLKKTTCRRFSWNRVKFELQVLDSLLFIFSKNHFKVHKYSFHQRSTKRFSRFQPQLSPDMPPLPRFDRIWKSVLKQFKKKSKKYKTFALHPNLCPSNHTNQQTWNNANLLKKSSQNGLSSMKAHGFQAKWPNLQLISNDSFPK